MTTHQHTLSIVTLAALLAAAPRAQLGQTLAGTYLPENRTTLISVQLRSRQVEQALQTALNSPGDTVLLRLDASASVAIIPTLNVGGGGVLEVSVQRTDHGIEATLSAENSTNAGIEAYEGLEIQVGNALARRVVFAWPDVASAAQGVQNLALGHYTAFGRIHDVVAAHAALAREAAEMLRAALLDLDVARRAEAAAADGLRGAEQRFASANRDLQSGRRAVNEAYDALRSVERRVSRLPRLLRWTLNGALNAARCALRDADRGLERVAHAFRQAESACANARRDLDAARAGVARRADLAESRRQLRDARDRSLGELRGFTSLMTRPLADLASRLTAVEFELRSGGQLQAFLSPIPGANIGNLGLGASASSYMGAKIRYELPRQGVQRLQISAGRTLDMAATGGLGAGVQMEVGNAMQVIASFVKRGSSAFAFDGVRTTFDLNVDVAAVLGVGYTMRNGVGRRVQIAMSGQDWLAALHACAELADNPSKATLVRALRQVEGDVKLTDHWLAGSSAQFGFSLAGSGARVAALATWRDAGTPQTLRLSVGAVLDEALRAETARESAALLLRQL